MASTEEDITEAPKEDDCWWDLPKMCGEIDPEEPFITQDAIERYSISHLKALADFYGFEREPDPESTELVGTDYAIPTLEATCLKLQDKKGRRDLVGLQTDRCSTISANEQKTYFDLYQKYDKQVMAQPTLEELAEIKKLGELHSKVVLEQEEFKKFIKETSASRRDLYEFMTYEMKRYVKHLSLSKLNAALKYPSWYKFEQIIQFFSHEKILKEAPVKFSLEKVVLTLGLVPRLVLPIPNMKCTLAKEYGKIDKRFPALKNDLDLHPSRKICSQDSIARSLAVKYKADVILTLSSFKTLLLLPPYENNWELMITITETEDGHKIVIMDKPLCPGLQKGRDQSYRYYKYSSKIQFSHFNPSRNSKSNDSAKKDTPEREKRKRELVVQDLEMFETENIDSVLDLEVFGLASPSPPKKLILKETKIVTKECNSEVKQPTVTDFKENNDEKECSETIKDIVDAIEKGFVCKTVAKASKSEANVENENTNDPELADKVKQTNNLKIDESETNSESEILVIDIPEAPQKNASDANDDTDLVLEETTEDEDDLPLKIYLKDSKIPKRVIATRSKTKLNSSNEVSDFVVKDNSAIDVNEKESDEKEDDLYEKMDFEEELLSPEIISPQSPTDSCKDSVIKSPKIIPLNEEVKDPLENGTLYPLIEKTENIRYSLFSLSNLKILFRGKTDSLKPPLSTPFMLYPKMEYFAQYSAEENTPKQICDQWAILATHPGSHLLRIRVNALNSEVLMQEEFTLESFMKHPEVSKLRLKPENTLTQMHFLLETFKSLIPGQYYLSHKKNESMATMYKEGTSKTFSLHALLTERLNNIEDGNLHSKESNWVNLDPSILIPSLLHNHKIPALFPLQGSKYPGKSKGANTSNKKKKSSKGRKSKK